MIPAGAVVDFSRGLKLHGEKKGLGGSAVL